MDCTQTPRLRINDKHYKMLSAVACKVNQVWSFCNETSHRAVRERCQWRSGYSLQKLSNSFSQCDGVCIGSPTVQQVCKDYAKARRQFKKAKLRWKQESPSFRAGRMPMRQRFIPFHALVTSRFFEYTKGNTHEKFMENFEQSAAHPCGVAGEFGSVDC
jgi:hypothetical protein